MQFKPTEQQRGVLLSIKFVNGRRLKRRSRLCKTPRIARISALFADHESICVDIYDDHDEAVLLKRFWRSIRPDDKIYAADAVEAVSLLRHRSWLLGVTPVPRMNESQVYSIELWDIGQMWTTGYTPSRMYIDDQPDLPMELENPSGDFEIVAHSCD